MEREAFRQRMQQYKQARENNPQLKYWDWKKYADGGEVKDNTYVAPVYKEQVFIPATGAQRIKNDFQYKYGSKSPYKGGELEIVSPEFDILTGVRGLKSITNDLLDNYVGRKLPSNYAYRRTVQQELDDIINTNSFREIPENVVTTGGRTITFPNGKTVTLKKAKGNSHGGKAFSAGDVWKGTTSSGNTSSEIIVGVPGDNAKWMVGKHGNYQGPYNFSDIEKGSAIFVPFDTEGVANISTEGLKYFKPSKYFNNRYIKYANGGIIDEDPPQNTSERPITNFDPKGDPYNPTYGYNPGAGYVSSSDPLGSLYVEGALLNPVFKLAGNAVSNVARGLKSITNDLLDNYVGRKLPSNYAYRRTVQQELDDIINTNSFREIPENVVTTGGRTITFPNGKTVTLKKAKGNSHGGKAFSAGDVWKGTTSSGNTSSEIIVGVPGDNAKWMVGKHGNYQGPYNFSDIEKGSAIFVPFDTEGVANISTEGLKYFKPSKYFNNRYIKYANGGIIDEDPPQNTSERPITNFDPKGDPYNPTYGYNPGAGYVSSSDPLGSLYVEGALLNPVFKLAGNAVSNVARGLTKYSSKYVPEVRRTVQDKINSLFRREAEDKARTYKLYDDAIESRNRIIEDLYSNPAYMERARQIKKAIRSLPKDMRSIEAAYLQFATPGQYTKWFNKIPLLGTYPIVNKQFQNYEEDKDKARKQR